MDLNRECYVITYRYKNVIRRIKKVKGIDIYYSSPRARYVTAYFDNDKSKEIIEQLKKIRGVLNVEPTRLDQVKVNIKL